MARFSPPEHHLAAADRRGNSARSATRGPARELGQSYLYTLPDVERETAQQQATFDKLMEMPEGPKQ